jgi:hypothetical protein
MAHFSKGKPNRDKTGGAHGDNLGRHDRAARQAPREELALPKSVEGCNLSLNKAAIQRMR